MDRCGLSKVSALIRYLSGQEVRRGALFRALARGLSFSYVSLSRSHLFGFGGVRVLLECLSEEMLWFSFGLEKRTDKGSRQL